MISEARPKKHSSFTAEAASCLSDTHTEVRQQSCCALPHPACYRQQGIRCSVEAQQQLRAAASQRQQPCRPRCAMLQAAATKSQVRAGDGFMAPLLSRQCLLRGRACSASEHRAAGVIWAILPLVLWRRWQVSPRPVMQRHDVCRGSQHTWGSSRAARKRARPLQQHTHTYTDTPNALSTPQNPFLPPAAAHAMDAPRPPAPPPKKPHLPPATPTATSHAVPWRWHRARDCRGREVGVCCCRGAHRLGRAAHREDRG